MACMPRTGLGVNQRSFSLVPQVKAYMLTIGRADFAATLGAAQYPTKAVQLIYKVGSALPQQ